MFLVRDTPLQKLSYINATLPVPTKLGFDEVFSFCLQGNCYVDKLLSYILIVIIIVTEDTR